MYVTLTFKRENDGSSIKFEMKTIFVDSKIL